MKNNFPYRQVHLDFHTSPHIKGIGSKFDKKQFQAALKAGNLDSITVFAKCHHGLCYYPTKFGTMHPELNFDLTGSMIDAAHEIGVRTPVYITAGWSELDAKVHPEWISVDENGNMICTDSMKQCENKGVDAPLNGCAWYTLCLNDGEYARHIYDITEEVCKRYKDIDGLFFDITIVNNTCYCPECLKGMKEMGLNPEIRADAEKYFIIKRKAFMEKCGEIMRKYHPDATVFFNSGGADQYRPAYHEYQTHFEMEDLPTAWGGYDKLPVRSKFFSHSGKPCLGMTGKFHLSWGEFGGFKSKEAIKYEIASMALYGVGCSVGDHMHPDGEMEIQTYESIGYAYNYLEKIAPYCYGGEPCANLGVFFSYNNASNEGLSNILLQNQIDYELVFGDEFERFDTVIFPDGVVLEDNRLDALNRFIEKGGKVVFMGESLVKNGKFQIDCGAEYLGKPEYDVDYIVTDLEYKEELPKAPMLCYNAGQRMRLTHGEVLAELLLPYFSRTVGKHCGHNNTPHNKEGERLPAIVKKGNVVYLAHSMPEQYFRVGSLFHKRYFMMALNSVYGDSLFEIQGLGSQGRATMIRQSDKNRYCVNMVYAAPVRRGSAEIIEDILPIYNIEITLNVKEEIKRAYIGVTGEELTVTKKNGKQFVIVPKLECHTSVVCEY